MVKVVKRANSLVTVLYIAIFLVSFNLVKNALVSRVNQDLARERETNKQPITNKPVQATEDIASEGIIASLQRIKTNQDNIPGGNDHRILSLSEEDLRKTAVNELMSWYGEANGGSSCADDFGNKLVNRWRETKKVFCKERDSEECKRFAPDRDEQSLLHSSIDCYLVHQTRHHGNGDNLCLLKNVKMNVGLFQDDDRTSKVVRHYVESHHNDQPYLSFPKGFLEGDCVIDPETWQSKYFPGWNEALTVRAFNDGNHALSKDDCDEWVDHPVLIDQRDTFANFFHDSEDFFNVFLALAILQWTPGEAQLFLTDLYPEGPFWDMWSRVFSHGHPARTAWDLKKLYAGKARQKGQQEREYNLCFKQLAIGIYGPAAPITVASWDTSCRRTALVRAYSDFVIRGLNLQSFTHYAQDKPSSTITVTYMARRPSKEWPERKYCNTTGSFFVCSLWDNFGQRKLGRMVRNDAEVVSELKGLEQETFADGRRVVVQDVDYNVLSFEQQIRIDLQTDIMIGPHGAGLMHNIFMRDRAHLIELFVDGSSANRHFHNLAFWYGREYTGMSISNPINARELRNTVRNAVTKIDIAAY